MEKKVGVETLGKTHFPITSLPAQAVLAESYYSYAQIDTG